MTPDERYRRIQEVFEGARALPAEQRAAYLDGACAGDCGLKAEVETLLLHASAAAGALPTWSLRARTQGGPRALDDADPRSVGPYRILRVLGEGGFGIVYLAEQGEPLVRQVALKVIRPGMDSRAILARFAHERQALAVMSHANIARVLDAGTTAEGRPYFAMEHIAGVPITEYCDQHRLTIRERIELFVPVCEAVQHAHMKGVIHRDLKPSNVLVAIDGGRATPKVIDFGVAKAIAHHTAQATIFSEQGLLVGTPEYMSPEQAEMTALDVDTRTDVYSLGVILYELLTGAVPFESSELRSKGFAEIQRVIRDVDPARPSTRLAAMGAVGEGVADRRRTRLEVLRRELRRELEWIPLKAMRKDRTHRYRSAQELADDLGNYLDGRALTAGPETALYRVRKFARRHRLEVALGGVVAAALLAGLAGLGWGYTQAASGRDEQARLRGNEERARQAADLASAVAQRKSAESEWRAYAADIAAAQAAIVAGDAAACRMHLERAPARFRGWEWDHVNSLVDESVATLVGHTAEIRCIALSADGRWIASGSDDTTVRIWAAATGEQTRTFRGHSAPVTCVRFAPDGALVISGSTDGSVLVARTDTGALERTLLRQAEPVRPIDAVAVDDTGRYVAASMYGNIIQVWDLRTGETVHRWDDDQFENVQLAFIPGSTRLLSDSGLTGMLNIRDPLDTGKFLALGESGMASPHGLAVAPDGSCAGATLGRALRSWRLNDSSELLPLTAATAGSLRKLAFSHDGSWVVAGSSDQTVRRWDTRSRQELRPLRGHTGPVTDVAVTPDDRRVVSASFDGTIKVWSVEREDQERRSEGHVWRVFDVAYSADGRRLASSSQDGTVRVWDTSTGRCLRVFGTAIPSAPNLHSVAISPDGRTIAYGGAQGPIWVWDLEGRGSARWTVAKQGQDRRIADIAFSPDSRVMATASFDRSAVLRDAATGETIARFEHGSFVHSVVFNRDGTRLLTAAGDSKVRIWDTITKECVRVLSGLTAPANTAVWNSAETLIVAGSADGRVVSWDLSGGSVRELRANQGGSGSHVRDLAFCPDGMRLAGATGDGVRIWDLASGDIILSLEDLREDTHSVEFSPDQRWLAAAADIPRIPIWDTVPLAARMAAPAEATVREWLAELGSPGAVAERIASDATMDPLFRDAASVALLRETESLQRAIRPTVERLVSEFSVPGDVIDAVRREPGLTALQRNVASRLALALAGDPSVLADEAWEIAKLDNRRDSEYELALNKAAAARATRPYDLRCLRAAGASLYRMGRFEEALAALMECDKLREEQTPVHQPEVKALLALCQFMLDREDEARASLELVRSLVAPASGNRDDTTRLLAEAESLIAPK